MLADDQNGIKSIIGELFNPRDIGYDLIDPSISYMIKGWNVSTDRMNRHDMWLKYIIYYWNYKIKW